MTEFATTPALTLDAPSIDFIFDSELEHNEGVLAGYTSTVTPIVNNLKSALVEREYAITDLVINAVSSNFNVPVETLRDMAENADLLVRPLPEPEPEVEEEDEADVQGETAEDGDKLDAILHGLKSIGERIEKLENAAKANGISL